MKYYRELFEAYGFKNSMNSIPITGMCMDPTAKIVEFPPRIMKIADWLSKGRI
jgi:hypothetical protein